jgi:exodeoxyribonuclease VII small subunit
VSEVVVSELTFEQAYAELAVVVEKLEDAGLTLEESLALHARGRELAAHCAARLEEAELRVRQLSASE